MLRKTRGTINNGPSKYTGNTEHKTQDEDKQNAKQNTKEQTLEKTERASKLDAYYMIKFVTFCLWFSSVTSYVILQ
jgi:hypothetical protein